MTKPFQRIDVIMVMHSELGTFRMTLDNQPGPTTPEQFGTYIAEKLQAQYDKFRTSPVANDDEVAELRAQLAEAQRQLASRPRRGRPPRGLS